MRKKLLCTISALAMLSGLFVVAAAPAQAAPPQDTQNFYPDDTPKSNTNGLNLSDRFDGVDSTVHLTNVSTTETTRVQWRLCPVDTVATTGVDTLTQAEFDSCTIIIGEDGSPTVPFGTGVDEAYEFNWDIPGSEDGTTRDLVAAACIGAGEDVENDAVPSADERNCALDIENDVLLDDAQTATPQTSSGEMVSICTTDVGGPGTGTEPCDEPTPGNNQIDPTVAALYTTFVHGDNVPNDGFTMRARTSDDITNPLGLINLGDAETDPNTPQDGDTTGDCTLIFTGTNFKEFECEFEDGDVPDDEEIAVTWVRNLNGGTGNCSTNDQAGFCEFDSHYAVSAERQADQVVATFRDFDQTEAEDCADTPDKANTNNLGDSDFVLFCVFDQFLDPFDTSVTFQNGPGTPSSAGLESTSDCSDQNHDGGADGVDEHCDGTSGSDGAALAEITNPDDFDPGEPALTGVQNVIACVESEPNEAVAAHGCQDEPAGLTDDVDKTWESNASDITLVYGNKDANCLTGPTFQENTVGQEDDLLACVFDFFGNPISTTGADDGFLEWSIGAGNDDEVDTQFVGTPPPETDTDGEAVGRIRAINAGSDDPTVCLRDEDTGDEIECDSVTKNVTGGTPGGGRPASRVTIRHRRGPHRFIGQVFSTNPCESGRNVVVRRRDAGPDTVIGSDATNANDVYRVNHRRTNRRFRYYARVTGNGSCRGDTSPLTPRVR